MFREAYIWSHRTETFMADDRFNYFRLHPGDDLACRTCVNRTCVCPHGMDIPAALSRVHDRVQALVGAKQHPGRLDAFRSSVARGHHEVGVLTSEVPERLVAGATGVARFLVQNAGSATWPASPSARGNGAALAIGAVARGRLVGKAPIRQSVSRSQRSHLVVEFQAPRQPGDCELRFFLMPCSARGVAKGATAFHSGTLTVEPVRKSSLARRLARKGVRLARRVLRAVQSGRTVATASEAPVRPVYGARYVDHTIPSRLRAGVTSGLRVTIENSGTLVWQAHPAGGQAVDVRVYIDDVLYAVLALPQPEVAPGGIQRAIRDVLDTGPLLPFPHPVEMDVSRMLAEDFPSAEMVVFGKNGSDVCTVAARLARLATGKRIILSCGFHGWQDFTLDLFGFADSGIPSHDRVLFKFRFNDRQDFFRLYDQHKNDLAAVMIEPAGPCGGPEVGIEPDADAGFLQTIAEAARRVNALLIVRYIEIPLL